MFKRFLEFLKGDSDREHVEGSYLSHLLDQVEPSVVEALKSCPQHDPLLLVAIEILRTTDEERWPEQEIRHPLVDAESPGHDPPPPPNGDADSPSTLDITEDVERVRENLVDDLVDTEEASRGEEETRDPNEPREDDDPSSNDLDAQDTDEPSRDESPEPPEAPDSPPPPPDGSPSADELADQPVDEPGYEVTSTVEVDSPHRQNHEVSPSQDGLPRLDSEPVLQAGRVFLGVLIENDRLPVDMQMELEDIERARDLLLGYFLGSDEVGQQAQAMLETVEDKFSEGLYSQAEILLELFESDRSTRIENDRNLFYDEMILRFGEHRRHGMQTGESSELQSRIESARTDDEAEDELFDWLAESSFLSFNMLARDLDELERWEDVAAHSSRGGVVEDFTSVIPPERWRLPSEFSRSLLELADDYISPEQVEVYILDHVKTCYFVLRAMGDTGLESYLDVFFDWFDEAFGVDGVALMPDLYQEMTSNERLIGDVFGELYAEHLAEDAEAIRRQWTRRDVESGIAHFYETLESAPLDQLRPGHYNLGHFILDDLFGLEYPTSRFAFNMHRLS